MSVKYVVSAIWIVAVVMTVISIRGEIKASYEFENKYSYAWNLSDKSSTIEAKCNYVTEFVELLNSNKSDFCNYNAIWLKTKDNSFDYNLNALTTLKDRLVEIKGMETSSFQYNTAIQQITAQEQGEAHALIAVIRGCYVLQNYFYVWDWIGALCGCAVVLLVIIGLGGIFFLLECY